MVASERLELIAFRWWVVLLLLSPVAGLRPLRERNRSWGDEWQFTRKEESDIGPFSQWNITGTYKGTWNFLDATNGSSRFPDIQKTNGNSVIELVSTPTKITGVHYVHGVVIFHDVFDNGYNVGGAQIRVEGVYIWPFRQLRMVANSGKGEFNQDEDYILSNPYHLLGVFSSQVLQDSSRDKNWRRKHSLIRDMDKHCNIEIAAKVSHLPSSKDEGEHDSFHLEGLMESPSADDSGVSFSPLVYNNKVVNYTLMVTFISFLQVLLLIRQMEHSSTQYGAAKVSILMIGQQAIMDAYLCFLHLTGVTLRESLFNAFATAAFSKFVVVSIFEKRYLLAIWEANRPLSHELSVFYSRYYGILLGGLLLIYEFHHYLKTIFLLMSSFWAVILLLQHYLGSRLFIPHQILPEKYCYCRRFDQDTRHAMDCVICMIAIDLSQGTNDCMVTPCDHFFHSGCLQRWMDIKLECPTCRRTLPPA